MAENRMLTLADEKAQILDWENTNPPVPDVGIYDGQVRYYKANLAWAVVIEGHLLSLANVAAWPEAEDMNYPAIQAILTFIRGIDSMTMEDDIAKGIYKAFNWLSLQVVSGQYANLSLSTDEDGAVTQTPEGASKVPLPEDDPDTEYSETEAANYGGTIAICRAIELYLDKIDAYYGATNNAPVTTQIATEELISAYFPCDETALDLALTAYYDYRVGNGRIIFDISNATQLYIYCHGSDATAFNQWLVDVSGYGNTKISVVSKLINALAPEFWSKYFSSGIEKPSTAYVDASCVKMKPQTHTGLLYGVTRTLIPNPSKGGHRIRNKVSGYYLDADGDLQDAFWYRTAAGVLTRSNFTFTHGSGANNTPSDNQVPYSDTHTYEYTIDLEAGNNSWSVQFNRNANMNIASTSPTGGFTIEIEDLGQYTL